MAFGELVRQTRKNMHLSQAELGELVGLCKSSICQYEKGKKLPRHQKLLHIAVALNLDIQILIQECIEPSKGIGWGKLGAKHEISYIPKYENDHAQGLIILREMVPFTNPGLPPGKYFWLIGDIFSDGTISSYGQSILLVQRYEDLCAYGHVVFHKIHEKALLSGMLIEHKKLLISGTNTVLSLNEVNLVGKVVQISLNL